MFKFKVHVLDRSSARRAVLARSLTESGAHPEIYESVDELAYRPLDTGLIIAEQETISPSANEGQLEKVVSQVGLPICLYAEEPRLNRAVKAMLHGAVDYVPWPISHEKLGELIHNTNSRYAERAKELKARALALEAIAKLSEREVEVLAMIIEGYGGKSVATVLGISPRTVEMHRARLFKKINAQSTADAIRIGFYAGLHRRAFR